MRDASAKQPQNNTVRITCVHSDQTVLTKALATATAAAATGEATQAVGGNAYHSWFGYAIRDSARDSTRFKADVLDENAGLPV